MAYFTLGYKFPDFIATRLFGDRQKFGLDVNYNDSCWKEWERYYLDFYYSNQKQSIGKIVNQAGYKIMRHVDLSNKKILELGPGDIDHIQYWLNRPKSYVIGDIQEEMLERSSNKLAANEISCEARLLQKNNFRLPFADNEFDIIISFYSLEHLMPLKPYLVEMKRILKNYGLLVGAIPAEGGLAWGLGRYFTSRKWLKKNTKINPDKIICWEHPNFADYILKCLDAYFNKKLLQFWPLNGHIVDANLIIKFIYTKNESI